MVLCESLIAAAAEAKGKDPVSMHIMLESLFQLALVHSVGSLVVGDERPRFSDWLRRRAEAARDESAHWKPMPGGPHKRVVKQNVVLSKPFPGNVFNFCFDTHTQVMHHASLRMHRASNRIMRQTASIVFMHHASCIKQHRVHASCLMPHSKPRRRRHDGITLTPHAHDTQNAGVGELVGADAHACARPVVAGAAARALRAHGAHGGALAPAARAAGAAPPRAAAGPHGHRQEPGAVRRAARAQRRRRRR